MFIKEDVYNYYSGHQHVPLT